MQNQIDNEKQQVLVRGTREYWNHMLFHFGIMTGFVRFVEENIAIAGRLFLLFYIGYTVVETGAFVFAKTTFPSWMDIAMLGVQVAGLEGSIPGLTHLSDDLEAAGRPGAARKVSAASIVALILLGLTGIDLILTRTPYMGNWNTHNLTVTYGNLLLIARIVCVGIYVRAMARINNKGPKVISAHAAQKTEVRDAAIVENVLLHQQIQTLTQEYHVTQNENENLRHIRCVSSE